MIYLMYQLKDNIINLYELKEGKNHYLKSFIDREDLLMWIEENYNMANLLIVNKNKEEK